MRQPLAEHGIEAEAAASQIGKLGFGTQSEPEGYRIALNTNLTSPTAPVVQPRHRAFALDGHGANSVLNGHPKTAQ